MTDRGGSARLPINCFSLTLVVMGSLCPINMSCGFTCCVWSRTQNSTVYAIHTWSVSTLGKQSGFCTKGCCLLERRSGIKVVAPALRMQHQTSSREASSATTPAPAHLQCPTDDNMWLDRCAAACCIMPHVMVCRCSEHHQVSS